MKCLNIIVFYDNKIEVANYITEVYQIAQGKVDIIMVVNSDKQYQVPELMRELHESGITCFEIQNYGENIGYLNAMLKTLKYIDMKLYRYIILSNTDIHYNSKNFFEKLLNKEYPIDVGCIAPSVYATKSNSYSNPHYVERISRKKLERLEMIFAHPFCAKIYLELASIKAGRKKKEKEHSNYVYSPHGCYMIFSREFVNKVLGYEYGVKLYSEESCVGELLLRNNMKCFYDESIEVIHQESSVTGKIDYKKRFSAWKDSIDYILTQFY